MDFGVCVCGLGVVGGRLGVENRSLLGGVGGWVGGGSTCWMSCY